MSEPERDGSLPMTSKKMAVRDLSDVIRKVDLSRKMLDSLGGGVSE